jgi:hypothetical protein
VPFQPSGEIEIRGPVKLEGISMEKVWHDDKIAIGRKLIGYQLGVDKAVPDHICEDEDSMFRGAVFGVCDIGIDCCIVGLRVSVEKATKSFDARTKQKNV